MMPTVGRLVRRDDGATVIEHLLAADRYFARLLGWQFRRRPDDDVGLLLVPCRSIHTFCLRFPLDAAFLDACGTVVEIHRGVRPWRIVVPQRPAYAVLEQSAGRMKLDVGTALRLVPAKPAVPRESLRFLAE